MSPTGINYQSHLFYIDSTANKYLPPWFLELATRQEAEEMLCRSAGNVLMRSHPSFASTGRYAISYRKNTDCFRHYLLTNTPDGFLLEIDHKNNRPVSCLSAAMDLFVKLTGRSAQPINHDDIGNSTLPLCTSPNYINIPQTSAAGELNNDVSRDLASSILPKPQNYINIPQTSAAGELNRNVPSNPEELGRVQPIHNYLNAPQLSAASSSSKFCSGETVQRQNAKEPRGYVNMQQLSSTEDTCAERLNTTSYTGFRSRPATTVDDFPPNIAPPLPEWN